MLILWQRVDGIRVLLELLIETIGDVYLLFLGETHILQRVEENLSLRIVLTFCIESELITKRKRHW